MCFISCFPLRGTISISGVLHSEGTEDYRVSYLLHGTLLFPLNPKVQLENLPTTLLTEELVQLPKVHVISSVSMGIKNSLVEPCELAVRGHAFIYAANHAVQWNILSMANHDPLPCQALYSEEIKSDVKDIVSLLFK